MKAAERLRALRHMVRQQDLVVLVWGPGDPGPTGDPVVRQYWAKRNQIRDHIASLFPNSEVLFSESDALRDYTKDLSDLLIEELAHASIADCIIVLDVTRGAHVEVDRFSAAPTIAAKITVLLPERFVGGTGLVSHVHKLVQVKGFSDAQFAACSVATEMAVGIVDSVAIQRALEPGLIRYI